MKEFGTLFLVFMANFAIAGEPRQITQAIPDGAGGSPAVLGETEMAARLSAHSLSPEERAIRVDAWQTARELSARKSRVTRVNPGDGQQQIRLAPGAPVPKTATPSTVNSEQAATESEALEIEIRDFRDSLVNPRLSPEARALLVDDFHRLNAETLAEFPSLRGAEDATGNPPAFDAGGAVQTAETSPEDPRAREIKSELDRIQVELAGIPPEDRAIYLERHLKAIQNLSAEIAEAAEASAAAVGIDPQLPSQQVKNTSLEPATEIKP